MSEQIIGGRRDGLPKETGDCYKVKRETGDRFLVEHFPDHETKKACCRIRVTVNDKDRAKDPDSRGETAALMRADRAIEEKHAKAKL